MPDARKVVEESYRSKMNKSGFKEKVKEKITKKKGLIEGVDSPSQWVVIDQQA